MKKPGGLIGIDTVTAGLARRMVKMNAQSLNGMRAATAFIREEMERTPPLVPVGKSRKGYVGGTLRASWFTEFIGKAEKGQVGVMFGFSANYAFEVHEKIDPEVRWSRPNSGPKFLQSALNRNTHAILEILKNSMI